MIIGFMGAIGAGKSTAATYVADDPSWELSSFAFPLKLLCSNLFAYAGAKQRHFLGTQADKNEIIPGIGKSGREILIDVGTHGFRRAYAPIWAEVGIGIARQVNAKGFGVVFDDVRFQEEVDAIHEHGGIVIGLIRENNPHVTVETSNHATEQLSLGVADYVVASRAPLTGDSWPTLDKIVDGLEISNGG